MKGLRLWFLFSLIFFLCLAAKAWTAGQTDREKMIKEYEAADLNKNGYVDENEYKQYIRKKFDETHNNEGQVTKKNESGKMGGEEFIVTGEEKEKKISFKEFLNGRLRFFNEADANNDRLLSFQEYTTLRLIDPVR